METILVRLKPYDHRRGHVLRRYTYAGIKFQVDRGWSRVVASFESRPFKAKLEERSAFERCGISNAPSSSFFPKPIVHGLTSVACSRSSENCDTPAPSSVVACDAKAGEK